VMPVKHTRCGRCSAHAAAHRPPPEYRRQRRCNAHSFPDSCGVSCGRPFSTSVRRSCSAPRPPVQLNAPRTHPRSIS
jgi:hypothetical protein